MREETRTIGGLAVTVTQFPCMRGLPLIPRLHIVDDFSSVSGAELQAFARDLLAGTSVRKNGTRLDLLSDEAINAAFGGDIKALLDALRFAVEVNFFPTSTEGAPADQPAQGAAE